MTTDDIPPIGHQHPRVASGWLRAAVFGAMDGLVSNLALIAGVAGGTEGASSSKAVVLAGLAGLTAGAFSMAAGEYTSVASQDELVRREVAKERREIIVNPVGEKHELARMYADHGIAPETAAQMAEEVHRDPELALTVHARNELGVDPHDLPSPVVAAASSFVSFAVGALVPLLPYLLGATSLLPGLLLTWAALFVCGAMVTRLTSRPWWYGGIRQLLLGGAAALLTYLIGRGIGSTGLA